MKQRIITGVIAGAAYIAFLWKGGLPFALIITLIAMIAFSEIIDMKKIRSFSAPGLIGLLLTGLFTFNAYINVFPITDIYLLAVILLFFFMVRSQNQFNFDDLSLIFISTLYVGLGFHLLINMRQTSLLLVLFVQLLIWTTDSGAYFVGRKFGRVKLSPISPKKTIEGSIGGILSAFIIAFIFQLFFSVFETMTQMILVTLIIAIFGQVGDLAESAIKRYYGVKDSGHILPGHGGLLDRFDSLLFILPILQLTHLI